MGANRTAADVESGVPRDRRSASLRRHPRNLGPSLDRPKLSGRTDSNHPSPSRRKPALIRPGHGAAPPRAGAAKTFRRDGGPGDGGPVIASERKSERRGQGRGRGDVGKCPWPDGER